MPRSVAIKVWGDFACFTRPENKAERVSYDVMTPSAARGLLESIYWKKHAFQWKIRAIHVLNPIRHFSLTRNEVESRTSFRVGQRRLQGGVGFFVEDNRVQRHTLGLRDVAYLIEAEVVVLPSVDHPPTTYVEQFQRRVERGEYYRAPYLGCREFAAFFAPPSSDERPQNITRKLGWMLYDLFYEDDDGARGQPHFFPAELEAGVLHVPRHLHREVCPQCYSNV